MTCRQNVLHKQPDILTGQKQLAFARRHPRKLLFWPAIAAIAIALTWFIGESAISRDRLTTRTEAHQHATELAAAYAEQIIRSVQEIDRVTRLVAQLWTGSDGVFELGAYHEQGIFPSNFFHASIANVRGDVVTSTRALPVPLNFSSDDWFVYHRHNRDNNLRVSGPQVGRRTGKTIIRFSRRMETAKGGFAGATWVTVEPTYLTTFFGGTSLAQDEFISLRLRNGPVLASKVGGSEGEPKIFFREHPVFEAEAGVDDYPAYYFRDDAARIVAWKSLPDMPMTVVTAATATSVYASHVLRAQALRTGAWVASVLLALLGATSAYYSLSLAWRKEREDAIKKTYRLAVDGAQEGFYILHPVVNVSGVILGFRIEDCNERAAEFFGKKRRELVGRMYSEFTGPTMRADTEELLRRAMTEGFIEHEYRVPPTDGIAAVWIYRRFIRSDHKVALIVRDISHHKAHAEQMAVLANTDSLTGLPNRHWMLQHLPKALQDASTRGHGFALCFIDLDNFKNVNDTLGHEAGDQLLCAVAARLKAAVRRDDQVIRLGGDEFTVLLDGIHSEEEVRAVAGAMLGALATPIALPGENSQQVLASIGVAMFPGDGTTGEALLKHADIAMYAAKAAGKGRYYFYQAHYSDMLVLRLSREHALRQAVELDQFFLHFQPRMHAATRQITSMEALVRWNHPEQGLVYPSEFIPLAEDIGSIVRLGELVILKTCAQIAAWRAQGVQMVPISVNIAPHQLKTGHVCAFLEASMRRYDIEPFLIGAELTESAVVDNSPEVTSELQALRRLGIKLMIDDFGTGHSSLAQLQRLDVDVLKIDKAFVDALDSGAEGIALLQAIMSMAHALDMLVVAEGVETEGQLAALLSLRCDEVQGYLVSPPVDADKAASLLKSNRRTMPARTNVF